MSNALSPISADVLEREVARRRTFAIISHPDAGKTTLTEKLLLYAGAIDQAGSVRARKNQRRAVSDWMTMEQERGISITSTVLQFDYQDHLFNLLDTPGHQDFSEDTYRVLMAVDSAVMVLDSAKGIETQTRKLFEVCRRQNLPILTFINKLDNPGREPLELLDEIERVLQLKVTPMNWPIGTGDRFQGVYDLHNRQVLLFQRTSGNKFRAPVNVKDIDDPELDALLGEEATAQLREEVELLSIAGAPFNEQAFLNGELTPVYFGSALNNFGVEGFLEALIELAPSPRARTSDQGQVHPVDDTFSGFVFKIQANMDPQHRDRMAFLRVCSGVFEKDMLVNHPRLGRKIRMSRPHRLFARDRETVDYAFPGDVIGLSNPGTFAIGDTVCSQGDIQYAAIPPFQPDCFAILRNRDISKYKQFNKGVEQLREEGVVQVLYSQDTMRREPILAAVGQLQFEVVVSRLAAEYNVEAVAEQSIYTFARWVTGDEADLDRIVMTTQGLKARDQYDNFVILLTSEWEMKYLTDKNPKLKFHTVTDLAAQA